MTKVVTAHTVTHDNVAYAPETVIEDGEATFGAEAFAQLLASGAIARPEAVLSADTLAAQREAQDAEIARLRAEVERLMAEQSIPASVLGGGSERSAPEPEPEAARPETVADKSGGE